MLRIIVFAVAVAVVLLLLFMPVKKNPPSPGNVRRPDPQYPGSNDVTQQYAGPVQNIYMHGKRRLRK